MAILDLQRRIAEAGRIRLGIQTLTDSGRTRPAKLETFRLTSADKLRIEQAAAMWGGRVEPWDAPSGRQWQVITESTALDVIVPPADMAFTQSYELWSAGGCQRRCDGVSETLSGGECLCDPEKRQCDIHTRLSVMLRDLPGLGVWRVDTQGYYAAVELQGAVQVIEIAAGRGQLLPARLLLVQRQVKRMVGDKPQTRKFAVPVLDVEVTPGQLLAPTARLALPAPDVCVGCGEPFKPGQRRTETTAGAGPLHGACNPELKATERIDSTASLASAPALRPVPASVQHRPAGTVAEQMRASTEPQERKRRANSAQPVPSTGVEPRTAAQAQADIEAAGNASAIRPYLREPDGEAANDTVTGNGNYPPGEADRPQAPPDEPDDGPGNVTQLQIRKLHAVLTGHGFNGQKERDTLLQVVEVLAGRELTGPYQAVGGNPRTTKNLSRAEAGKVIDQLEACDGQDAVWELVTRLTTPVEEAQLFPDTDPPPF